MLSLYIIRSTDVIDMYIIRSTDESILVGSPGASTTPIYSSGSSSTLIYSPGSSTPPRYKCLKALDESFSSKNYVMKFLRALHPKWRVKVMVIEEPKDLSSLAMTNNMVVRKFKKFFRRKGKFVRQPREEKKSFQKRDEKKGKSDQKCFRSGDPNHLAGDCPKTSRNKDQKAFIGGLGFDSGKASTSGNKTMSFVGSSAEKAMDGSTVKVHISTLPGSVCLRTCLEPDEWIKDSGRSKHMTGNKSLFSTYKAYNGEHVDNLAFNLLSVGQIYDNKCQVLFTEEDSEITKDGKIIRNGIRKNGLYVMKLGNKSQDKLCLAMVVDNSTLWRRRLGHANTRLIKSLSTKELVRNLPKLKYDKHFCDAFKIGKQAHASHKAKNMVSTQRCLELLHTDLFSPSEIKSYEDGIFFNQSKYINKMLKKFGLEDSKPTKMPMSTEIKLTKGDKADSVDNSKYRGTGIETIVYADSDHAGDYVDRKSTSGVCMFMG
nr:hypothetical protein [Tanacetum cinerariifolium]